MSKRDSSAPRESATTLRQQLRNQLLEGAVSAKELSAFLSVPERDIGHHLHHLEKSLRNQGEKLVMTPATCLACGFVFRKRERLNRPSSCPICHSERIDPPLFHVVDCGVRRTRPSDVEGRKVS